MGFPGGSVGKNLPTMQEMWVQILNWDDPLEKEIATYSNILAWKIPWTEDPRGLQCTGLQRIRCNWSDWASAAAKCLTLCDPMDGSTPGSPVPGILQARTLEWVAISFSKSWKWKVKVKTLSHVWLLVTPWTVAYQVPLSMGFSRQEYWSGLPFRHTFILRIHVCDTVTFPLLSTDKF